MSEKQSVQKIPEQEVGRTFSFMVEHVHDYAIFIMDRKGTILKWNKAAELMKGFTESDAVGSFFGILYTEEGVKKGAPQRNLKLAAEDGTFQEEAWCRRKDGSLFWAMIEIIAIKTPNGALSGFCKITRDISNQKELQDQLATEKERAEVTLAAIGEAVVAIDADGNVDYLNAKAEQLTGWTNSDARGHPLPDVFHVTDESPLHAQEDQLVALLKQGQSLAPSSSAKLVSKEGVQYAIEDTASPIYLPGGRIAGAVIVCRDVTDSRHLLETATYQAAHDALTGLVNRTEFEKCLQRSLKRAQQSSVTGALLYMDLDQFKIVNDTCGHDAGDALLKQIANLYRNEIRDRDILARLGGDEFALIADHCSKDEAHAIANKILESTRNYRFARGEHSFSIGVSIGLAIFDESMGSTQELLKLADNACYAAKQKGRNQIYSADATEAFSGDRKSDIDWVERLNEAMRLNQLELHYQSIATANAGHGRLHLEVLLRLVDTEHGVILPSIFLPAAERYDLMPKIDRWVVQRLLQWLDEHREQAGQIELCAINLSAGTLADESFLGYLADLLEHYQIAPSKLCFEITGAAAVLDTQKSLALMNGMRAMGCKVSLGGIKSGTVSFAHLRQFPADFIKLDASNESAITQSIVDEKMITSVNEIAHLMGQKTIAECVEDQATADVLQRIGIDYLQGRLIQSPQEFAKLRAR